MQAKIPADALDILLRKAHTHNVWQNKLVDPEILQAIYNDMRWGPTSANCCPLRIVFVTTPEAKERLKPCLDKGNVEKTMTAPVTAIFADDHEFYEKLPKLFPHADARSWFVGKPDNIKTTAFRNGTLQSAYFMLTARAYGLDCGGMSGFNNAKVDEEFFQGTAVKSNWLCNLGYGEASKLFPRSPRLEFYEACQIV